MDILHNAEKQGELAQFGGWQKDMARRRYQKGNLRKRGKRNPVWELQWWTDCINADGTIGRKRESTILGYVSELTRRQARKRAEEHLRPLNFGQGHAALESAFSGIHRTALRPECLSHPETLYSRALSLHTQHSPFTCLWRFAAVRYRNHRSSAFCTTEDGRGLKLGNLRSLAQLDVQDIHDREEMELLPRAKSRLRSGVTRKACQFAKSMF